jgi:hypothetical protein
MSIPKISAGSGMVYLWDKIIAEWNCWNWRPSSDTIYYLPLQTDFLDHSWNWFTFNRNWTTSIVNNKANIPVCYINRWSLDVSSSTYTFWSNDFTISYRINLPSDQDSYYRWVFWFDWTYWWLCVNYEWQNLSVGKWYTDWVFSENWFYSNIRNTWEYQVTVREWSVFKTYRNWQLYKSKTTSNFTLWQWWASVFWIWRHQWTLIKNLYISEFVLEKKARSDNDILKNFNRLRWNYSI